MAEKELMPSLMGVAPMLSSHPLTLSLKGIHSYHVPHGRLMMKLHMRLVRISLKSFSFSSQVGQLSPSPFHLHFMGETMCEIMCETMCEIN